MLWHTGTFESRDFKPVWCLYHSLTSCTWIQFQPAAQIQISDFRKHILLSNSGQMMTALSNLHDLVNALLTFWFESVQHVVQWSASSFVSINIEIVLVKDFHFTPFGPLIPWWDSVASTHPASCSFWYWRAKTFQFIFCVNTDVRCLEISFCKELLHLDILQNQTWPL